MRFLTFLFFGASVSSEKRLRSHQFLRDFYVNQTVCSLVRPCFGRQFFGDGPLDHGWASWRTGGASASCLVSKTKAHIIPNPNGVRNEVEEKYSPDELGEGNTGIFTLLKKNKGMDITWKADFLSKAHR